MKKLITLALFAALLAGCTDKEDPQPCEKRKDVYDRREMPRVR